MNEYIKRQDAIDVVATNYRYESDRLTALQEIPSIDIEEKRKLTDLELADLFAYCARLAKLVSPRDAQKYYGFSFDGAISDTLTGLAVMYHTNGDIDHFKNDELFGPVFNKMVSDIHTLLEE